MARDISTDTAIAANGQASWPLSIVPGRPATLTVAGHELTVFVEAVPLIAQMILDIRSARTRVWLEVYIFHDDSVGQAVAEALKERARAGVEVRVLYDAIGSQATSRSLFDELRRAGVQVHEFHSLWECSGGSPFCASSTAATIASCW